MFEFGGLAIKRQGLPSHITVQKLGPESPPKLQEGDFFLDAIGVDGWVTGSVSD